MKTIEERAYASYADDNCPADCENCEFRTDCSDVDYVQAYIDGARSEHALLTEWHDPKEPPKEEYMTILLRFRYNKHIQRYMYSTGFYGSGQFIVGAGHINYNTDNITGWRYIHEND